MYTYLKFKLILGYIDQVHSRCGLHVSVSIKTRVLAQKNQSSSTNHGMCMLFYKMLSDTHSTDYTAQ